MNAECEFEYASYKKVHQPQYDTECSSDYFQYKLHSYIDFDMKKLYPDESEQKLKILQEIYDSEKTYVIFLTVIEQVFLNKFAVSGILSKKNLRLLFGDVSAICQTNQILLESLRTKPVADAFLKLLPYLKLYSSYASQYPNSLKIYATLLGKRDFTRILEQIESDSRCQGHKLNSLLIMPVQRIPRYILLIEKLMRFSTDPQDMHNLCKVVSEIRMLSDHMQMCMATYENGERLLEIQQSFALDKHVFEPGRILVKEGVLYKFELRGSPIFQERVFFLFNDILLYGKKRFPVSLRSISKYEPSAMLALRHTQIELLKTDGAISIICGDARIVVTADTYETVQDWFDCLTLAIERAKELRKTLRKDSFNKKVLFFDKSFWKRRKNAICSMMSHDVSNTVERVFSRRRPLQQLNDSDFLSGNWTNSRKRKNVTEDIHDTTKKMIMEKDVSEIKSNNLEQIMIGKECLSNETHTSEDKILSENNMKLNKEDVDEEDRRPRSFGEERKKLAVNDIRKLSYQPQMEIENGFDDKEDTESVGVESKKDLPWWAVESAPPVIKNQKTGLLTTALSNCSIM